MGGEAKAYTHDWENQKDRESVLDSEGVDTQKHLTILNRAGWLARQFIMQLGWTEDTLSPLIQQYASFTDFADALQKVYAFKEDESDDTSNTRQRTSDATLHAEVVTGGSREMINPTEDSINEVIEGARNKQAESTDLFAEIIVEDNATDEITLSEQIESLSKKSPHQSMVRRLGRMMEVWYGIIRLTAVSKGRCK